MLKTYRVYLWHTNGDDETSTIVTAQTKIQAAIVTAQTKIQAGRLATTNPNLGDGWKVCKVTELVEKPEPEDCPIRFPIQLAENRPGSLFAAEITSASDGYGAKAILYQGTTAIAEWIATALNQRAEREGLV